MQNKFTIEEKSIALLSFLKTCREDTWIREEIIIENLPDYFQEKYSLMGTTLDRAIHTCVDCINKAGGSIIVNNGKRAFKLANKDEAKIYAQMLIKKAKKGFKRAYTVIKTMQLDGSFDLFKEEYKEIFKNEQM